MKPDTLYIVILGVVLLGMVVLIIIKNIKDYKDYQRSLNAAEDMTNADIIGMD